MEVLQTNSLTSSKLMNVKNRTIFEGDNLHILRGLDSETMDLIYMDPPFNSNRTTRHPSGARRIARGGKRERTPVSGCKSVIGIFI